MSLPQLIAKLKTCGPRGERAAEFLEGGYNHEESAESIAMTFSLAYFKLVIEGVVSTDRAIELAGKARKSASSSGWPRVSGMRQVTKKTSKANGKKKMAASGSTPV